MLREDLPYGPGVSGLRWAEALEAMLVYALLEYPHDQRYAQGFVERWLTPLDVVRGSLAGEPPIADRSWRMIIKGVRATVTRGADIAGLYDAFDNSMFADVGLVLDQRDPMQLMIGLRWASTWLSTSVLNQAPPQIFVERWENIARQCVRAALYFLLIQPVPVSPP